MFKSLGSPGVVETSGNAVKEGEFLINGGEKRKSSIGSDFAALEVEDEFFAKFGSNLGVLGDTLCVHKNRLSCRD